jgi:hypothetical protein
MQNPIPFERLDMNDLAFEFLYPFKFWCHGFAGQPTAHDDSIEVLGPFTVPITDTNLPLCILGIPFDPLDRCIELHVSI